MDIKTKVQCKRHNGTSLVELMAAVSIIGALSVLALSSISSSMDSGSETTCHINKAEIEIQSQRWFRATGNYPSSNLTTVGADLDFFPEGIPTCPVDGSSYTIDSATGLVVGHDH